MVLPALPALGSIGSLVAGTPLRAAATSLTAGLGIGSVSDGAGGPLDSLGDSLSMVVYAVIGLAALLIISQMAD